jgi:hypothetical protein
VSLIEEQSIWRRLYPVNALPRLDIPHRCHARGPDRDSWKHTLRELPGQTFAKRIMNLITSEQGGAMKPFSFSTIGQLAAIGQRAGVARIFGVNFPGFTKRGGCGERCI